MALSLSSKYYVGKTKWTTDVYKVIKCIRADTDATLDFPYPGAC